MSHRIGYLLVPGFALLSHASVAEPFRAANLLAGCELYRARTLSLYGGPVPAAGGGALMAEAGLGVADLDTLIVFAAGDPARFDHPPTFAWLRRLAAAGVTLGGVSGGPWLLARAGLLEGHHATIHWEHAAPFAESFPGITLLPDLFVIDRARLTCAGGMAGLDLATELIARAHGPLARAVRDWFIGAPPRDGPQRAPGARFGVNHAGLRAALAAVEAGAGREAAAAAAGVGVRQLERLFRFQLGRSISRHRTDLAIERADALLRQTAMPVTEIALACGFSSASQFARAFRRTRGMAPGTRRRTG